MKKLISKIVEIKTKDDIFPKLMISKGTNCIYFIHSRRGEYCCGMRAYSSNPNIFKLGEYREDFESESLEDYFGKVELSFEEE